MRTATAVAMAAALWGCSDDSGGSASIMVRVRNDRTSAVEVSIGPADYGEIAPDETTDYRKVSICGNDVRVDGMQVDTAEFCCADEGAAGFCNGHWTYFVSEGGNGFSSDDFAFGFGGGADAGS